eukprot:CCRYP_010907-RA/>CCRYP_010907-RA protein AED:0.05 eAED:-0.03 QI:0/0/0/1/1/1/2/0/452
MTTFYADEDTLSGFSSDIGGLWCRPIDVLDEPPDSFVFLRDYVHPKVPCIIRNAIPPSLSFTHSRSPPSKNHEEGSMTLTLDDIIDHIGESFKITVDVTPDGHGDAVRTVACLVESTKTNGLAEVEGRVLFSPDGQLKESFQKMFVKPHEQEMTLAEFRRLLRSDPTDYDKRVRSDLKRLDKPGFAGLDSNERMIYPMMMKSELEAKQLHMHQRRIDSSQIRRPVVYYSRQNDCLRTEMAALFSTGVFPSTFAFAEEAFGTGPPDAVNLWIGNERSVSSTHKDHYENLFYVCSGQKEFILNPPADILFLHEGEFPCGSFHPCHVEKRGESSMTSWAVVPEYESDTNLDNTTEGMPTKARWIEPDIKRYLNEENGMENFPLLSKSHPIKVLVSQGEMLYIPSLWLHHVTQTMETVGVNYWYDMKFDGPHWSYFHFLQQLGRTNHRQMPRKKPF